MVLGLPDRETSALHDNTLAAVKQIGLEDEVICVTDLKEFAKYGVSVFPAVIVDGKIVSEGKVCTVDELIKIIIRA